MRRHRPDHGLVQFGLDGPEQIGVHDGGRGAVDFGPLGLWAINVRVALAGDVNALSTVEVGDAHVDGVAQDVQYGARVPQRAEG